MIICLKNLAQKHSIAILASIHQPNNNIVNLFNQLYVLTSRGQCVYNDHPIRLKDYLVECQVQLMDYQVSIEELIKIASIDSNNDVSNKLVDEMFNDSILSNESFIKDSKLLKNSHPQEIKSFNLTDVLILLRRTARNELIGGWRTQIALLICYSLSLITMIYLFPNDIGSDPGCTEERTDLRNISLVNQRILDVLIGNEQKYQQNIKFIFLIILVIYFFNIIQLCCMFYYEIEVKFLF